MVEPGGQDGVEGAGQHQLAIDVPQRPEGEADVVGERKGESGQPEVLQATQRGLAGERGVRGGAGEVVGDAEREVDGLDDLRGWGRQFGL